MKKFTQILLVSALLSTLLMLNNSSAMDYFIDSDRSAELYQHALAYRDGKVPNFPKDSPEALNQARKTFLILAIRGNEKAMHNVGMIDYKQKRYKSAYDWFKRAAERGLSQSRNNMDCMHLERLIPAEAEAETLPAIVSAYFYRKAATLEEQAEKIEYILTRLNLKPTSWKNKACYRQPEAAAAEAEDFNFKSMSLKPKRDLVEEEIKEIYDWLEKYLTNTDNQSYQQKIPFLLAIALVANRESISLFNLPDRYRDKADQLKDYEKKLGKLLRHKRETVLELLKNDFERYIRQDISVRDKLEMIYLFDNRELPAWRAGQQNVFYNPELCKILLDQLLSDLECESVGYDQACEFANQTLFATTQRSNHSNGTYTERMLLERLAEIGNHWHKVLYADKFAELISEPLWGAPEANQMSSLLQDENFHSFACGHLGLDPSTSQENLLKNPAFMEVLSLNSRSFMGMKVVKDTREGYIKKAVDQAIGTNDVSEVLNLHRVLSHGGGFIKQQESADRSGHFARLDNLFQFTGTLSADLSNLQPHFQKLQKFLSDNNVYNPPYKRASEIEIQQLSELTEAQSQIFDQVLQQEAFRDVLTSDSGSVYAGGVSMSGGKVFMGGGLVAVQNKFDLQGQQITDGAIFIIANHFTLSGTVDALGGLIVLANHFDLTQGQVWNPQNAHFIKGTRVSFDKPYKIS